MTIELQFDDKATRELLNAVVKNITNAEPVFKDVGNLIVAGVKDNFEVGGAFSSPDSIIGGDKKWQSLSESTMNSRKRKDPNGPWPILQVEGNLRDSVVSKPGKDSVIVGTILEYAAIQHFGSRKDWKGVSGRALSAVASKKFKARPLKGKRKLLRGRIPARPFMTIHPDVLSVIDQTLINYIITGKGV